MRPINNSHGEMLIVPAVVCLAFSIELYLKGILDLETGTKPGFIHKLSDLFTKLSPQSRKDLSTALSCNETVLLENIKKISNIFIDWRYIYEQTSSNIDVDFLNKLASGTKSLFESMLAKNL